MRGVRAAARGSSVQHRLAKSKEKRAIGPDTCDGSGLPENRGAAHRGLRGGTRLSGDPRPIISGHYPLNLPIILYGCKLVVA